MRGKGCIYNAGVMCDGKGDCRICGWCTDESLKAQAEAVLEEEQKRFEERTNDNPYWERICEMAKKQRAKGIDTYGQGLEDNPADMIKRIEHLQEELIDGLMYCEWIKDKIAEGE